MCLAHLKVDKRTSVNRFNNERTCVCIPLALRLHALVQFII